MLAFASISNDDKSSVTPTVYSYSSVLNLGLILKFFIDNDSNPNVSSVSVLSGVSVAFGSSVGVVSPVVSVGFSAGCSLGVLVIVNVYSFVVFPSSAVTTTFAVFSPSFNDILPAPVAVALSSLGMA